MMLGLHHSLFCFYTSLIFAFFHLQGERAKSRGIPLPTHAESFDTPTLEVRLHEDLQILRSRRASELEPTIPSL